MGPRHKFLRMGGSRTNVRCRVSAQNTSSSEQQRRARYRGAKRASASKQALRQMTHQAASPSPLGTKTWPAGCFKEGEQNYDRPKFSG